MTDSHSSGINKKKRQYNFNLEYSSRQDEVSLITLAKDCCFWGSENPWHCIGHTNLSSVTLWEKCVRLLVVRPTQHPLAMPVQVSVSNT